MIEGAAGTPVNQWIVCHPDRGLHCGGAGENDCLKELMYNFSFLIDGLAGSACPGVAAPLEEDLNFLREQGVDTVVTLTEAPVIPRGELAGHFHLRHIPVPDYHAPAIAQIEEFVRFVRQRREEGGKVLVHCMGGIGRTGTMLAAWLIAEGASASDAIRTVRAGRPGSIETESQVRRLREWEAHVRQGEEH
jgi:atypical dual specificity phosphatase